MTTTEHPATGLPSPDGRGVDQLLDDLGSRRASVRQAAVEALTASPPPGPIDQVLPRLAEVLQHDVNENVRAQVAQRLGALGPQAVDPLIAVLQDEGAPGFVRGHAARSLGGLRVEAAVDVLAFHLTNAPDAAVRHACVAGLETIGSPAAAERLAAAVGQIDDDKLAGHVVHVLQTIGKGTSAADAVDALFEVPKGESTVLAAITALRSLKGTDAVPRLSEVAASASQPDRIRLRAVEQLGEVAAPSTVVPLVHSLVQDRSATVRRAAARALANVSPSAETVDALLEVGEALHLEPGDLDRGLLIVAFERALKEGFPDGSDPVVHLIGLAAARQEPSPLLGALVLALCGDSVRAGERVNEYERQHDVAPDSLRWLRIELGGTTALDPILDQLREDLHEYFQVPVHQLNEETRKHWETTLSDARWGFRIRMAMSVVVFVVGVLLLVLSSWQFLFGSLDAAAAWGTGASFVGGLSAMLLVIYSGPLKDIRQAVEDLGTSNAIFIAYVHRVLQVSHTFSALYLRERVGFAETEHAAKLMKAAMRDSVNALAERGVNAEKEAGNRRA